MAPILDNGVVVFEKDVTRQVVPFEILATSENSRVSTGEILKRRIRKQCKKTAILVLFHDRVNEILLVIYVFLLHVIHEESNSKQVVKQCEMNTHVTNTSLHVKHTHFPNHMTHVLISFVTHQLTLF